MEFFNEARQNKLEKTDNIIPDGFQGNIKLNFSAEENIKALIERCIKKIDSILDAEELPISEEEYSINTFNFLKKYGHI